jgi:phage protein D
MPEDRSQWIDLVEILVERVAVPRPLTNNLLDVMVDTSLYLPAMFMLRFQDDGGEWLDRHPFTLGKEVEIKLGARGERPERVMVGEVTAIEPAFTEDLTCILVIRGYDRSHRLNRGTRSQVFLQASDSDIAQKIGQGVGLQVKADSTSTVYEHVFQHNQTDLAFLQERARKLGYEVRVDDKTLHFSRPTRQRERVTLEWGASMRSFFPRLTLAGQVDEVTVRGWEAANKKEIIGKATHSRNAPVIGVGGQGGALAAQYFSSAKQVIVRQPVTSQPEADALAQAILDEINAGFVEAEGVAWGDPKLLAGVEVDVQRLGKRFSGQYVLTSAVHLYTHQGYEVQFRVEGVRARQIIDLTSEQSVGDSQGGGWGGVVPAVVTNNNDPKGMSRVKLKFPWIDSALESDWARVSAVGAGKDRGLFWLPEVNDEVLVAFEHGDFRHPYVVGGLWNGKDSPPEKTGEAVKNGKVEIRTLKTREGHVIRLVDESSGPCIEIKDGKGKHQIKLDVSGNKLIIETQGDLQIKSTGSTTIESTGNLNIKGKMNVSVEAGAQLNLKGTMVNIN